MKGQFIYKIVNTTNGKFYVGSTTNTRERFRTHRNKLRANKHHCAHLQAAWNKYGEDVFVFHVIETVGAGESLQAAEDKWLEEHVGQKYCYNAGLRSGAPWRGVEKERHPNYGKKMADTQKELLREARATQECPRTGTHHTEETKQRIREKKLANPTRAWLGKTRDEETRAKIGDTQRGKPKAKGRKVSAEGMAKIRAAAEAGHYDHWKGRKHTEEAKQKMSKRVFEITNNQEFPSLTAVLQHYEMTMPTLRRALVSGEPISKGKFAGLWFKYLGITVDTQQNRRKLLITR